jgi:NADH:ubiquinone oxidoreductase subunit 5 (subunit L)/multisubunit Na+/H+ antiporter MnhA subunit
MWNGGARRALVATVAALETLLAAIVVLGMATGMDRQFDKGVAPLGAVIVVQSLGVVCLLVFGGGLRACALTWRLGQAPLSRWFGAALTLWVLWAFFRVAEYSS